MATRNLFSIILKVIGIFMLKDIVLSGVQLVSLFLSWDEYGGNITIWAGTLLTLLAYYIMFHFLVFKTDFLIHKLKLDKVTDQHEFSFFKQGILENIQFKPILTLAVLITSVYLFVTEIPNFFRLAFVAYQQTESYRENGNESTGSYIALSAVKIIIAYILLNACEPIVNFIDNKRSKAEDK